MKTLGYTITNHTFILHLFLMLLAVAGVNEINAQEFINKGVESFSKTNREDLPPGWDYQSNTENPHGIIVVLDANPRINDIPLKEGDFIGAFYEDDNGELKCGGADSWTETGNIIFAVFGDDGTTPEKDGFSYAETMHFKVFYQDNQKDYDVTTIDWDPGYYSTNKWSPLGLSSATNLECTVGFDAYATVDVNPICIGESLNLDGHIFIGTTGNYTWQWSSVPAGLDATTQSASHTPLVSTSYLLEVSDGVNISTHEIFVEVYENPEVNPGEDVTVCVNQSVELQAQISNSSGVLWDTYGDGTFESPGTLSATYHPGPLDIQNLGTTISVTAFPLDPCQMESTEDVNILMQDFPEVLTEGNLEFCENQSMLFVASAERYSTSIWSTSGDGTFSDPLSLATEYFPGTSDLNLNEFELTIEVWGQMPCQVSATAQVSVSTFNVPGLNAPSSKTSCESNPVTLNSIAFNHSSSLWTTDGDGTFLNPEMLSTVYYPGIDDKVNGGTTVTIYAYGNGVCEPFAVNKNIDVILLPNPTANAGPDMSVCNDGTAHLQATASDYTFVSWAGTGDGYFDNPYVLDPVYYPGVNDFLSGEFSLFISAYATYPCTELALDTVTVSILPNPEIEIGLNSTSICYGENFLFSQTTASFFSNINWFTINGEGTFDDNSIINPTYYPNPEHDYSLGSVIIGASALPIEPCTISADDFFTLSFVAPPQVDAGADATILQGETFFLTPLAENYLSVLWETSGDGSFSSTDILSPAYYPGNGDVNMQSVVLYIYAMPLGTCTTTAEDSLILTILKNQELLLQQGNESFSSYIDFEGKSFEEVLDAASGELIFAQKFGQVYWPEYNINTIKDFSNTSAYRFILESDVNLSITGFEVVDKTIILNEGWNMMPVLSSCPVDCQEFVAQLGNALAIITEVGGDKFFWTNGPGSVLTNLQPGKAYMIKVESESVFVFPECEN